MSQQVMFMLVFLCLVAACGNDRSQTRGAALYARQCAICHGADGTGGGGAGVVGLSGTPSDLTQLAGQSGGEFPREKVFTILNNYAAGAQAGRLMQPFSHLASPDTVRVRTDDGRRRVPQPQADLLAYLEALQRP